MARVEISREEFEASRRVPQNARQVDIAMGRGNLVPEEDVGDALGGLFRDLVRSGASAGAGALESLAPPEPIGGEKMIPGPTALETMKEAIPGGYDPVSGMAGGMAAGLVGGKLLNTDLAARKLIGPAPEKKIMTGREVVDSWNAKVADPAFQEAYRRQRVREILAEREAAASTIDLDATNNLKGIPRGERVTNVGTEEATRAGKRAAPEPRAGQYGAAGEPYVEPLRPLPYDSYDQTLDELATGRTMGGMTVPQMAESFTRGMTGPIVRGVDAATKLPVLRNLDVPFVDISPMTRDVLGAAPAIARRAGEGLGSILGGLRSVLPEREQAREEARQVRGLAEQDPIQHRKRLEVDPEYRRAYLESQRQR